MILFIQVMLSLMQHTVWQMKTPSSCHLSQRPRRPLQSTCPATVTSIWVKKLLINVTETLWMYLLWKLFLCAFDTLYSQLVMSPELKRVYTIMRYVLAQINTPLLWRIGSPLERLLTWARIHFTICVFRNDWVTSYRYVREKMMTKALRTTTALIQCL